ncbi:hypothetical protein H1R20_g10740, partial [Candolleomyces eurysporus]
MATPHVSDFQGSRPTNSGLSKRAKLVHVPSEETERNRGIGPESNAARGKQRATFHFFEDFPLDILGEACLRGSQSLFMYLEARTQLCRQCSCKETQPYLIGRFKRWTHLPKQIDESLADIIPATTQPLTAKERKQHTELKREERTRFHVKTALKLDEELRKIRSKKQKAIWLAEKQAERKEIEEHRVAFAQYFHRQEQKQREYKQNRPHRREDSIREKLIEQGPFSLL